MCDRRNERKAYNGELTREEKTLTAEKATP